MAKKKRITFVLSEYQKYVMLIFVVAILYLTYKLIQPYIVAILTAIVVALVFYPLFKWLNKKIDSPRIWSLVLVLGILIIIGVPSVFLVNAFARDTYSAYTQIKGQITSDSIVPTECNSPEVCSFLEKVDAYLKDPEVSKFVSEEIGSRAKQYFLNYGKNFILQIPHKIISIFIFAFLLYFLFKDGKRLMEYLKDFLPLDHKHQQHLYTKTKSTIYAVLYGQFLTAGIQGAVGGLIFWLLGIPSPIFWGAMMALFAIIPIGTWIIWGPASIWLAFQGIITGSGSMIFKGILLFVLGIGIISAVDNLIRPILIGKKAKANIAIIVIGLFGGLALFGFIGIFIGPIILTLLIAMFNIYKEMQNKSSLR